MIEKIICSDLNLDVTYGTSIFVIIDNFKFVKDEGSFYIVVQIEENGDYTYLDEIVDEFEITEHEELKKEAIKWLFKKVSVE